MEHVNGKIVVFVLALMLMKGCSNINHQQQQQNNYRDTQGFGFNN